MLTILLTDDDHDRRGNLILGNVAKAIAQANLPDAERKLNSELTSKELERAKEFNNCPQNERKRLIFERTEHCLIDVDADVSLGIPYTRRYANLFTAEKNAWAEIRAGVVSNKLHPIDPDNNGSLGGDNYGHGGVTFDQLAAWGRAAGYEFRIATSNDSQCLTGEPPIVGAGTDEIAPDVLRRYVAGWHDPRIDEKLFLALPSVLPRDAAMLLCWFDPKDARRDPMTESSNETGPEDFNRLLLLFESTGRAEQKERTLIEWLAIAREKGFKYHSWVDAHALEQIEELPVDGGEGEGCAVKDAIDMKPHTKGSKWDVDEWKGLLRAVEQRQTPEGLAEFHQVSRQVINTQLKNARKHFRAGKVADLSLGAQARRIVTF